MARERPDAAERARRAAYCQSIQAEIAFGQHLRAGLSPRAALAATCADLGIDPGEDVVHVPAKGGPDAGHTFEITWRSRGSFAVTGQPHHDADYWSAPIVARFRAWSLAEALDKARALPFERWMAHLRESAVDSGSSVPQLYGCGHRHTTFDRCGWPRPCAECKHIHDEVTLVAPKGEQPGFPDGEWMCEWCKGSDYDSDPLRVFDTTQETE